MYDQIREDTVYIMLYASVVMLSLIASCYLMFRQGNAFARDITPPIRLRQWTAAFFALIALNHVWYMPILFLSSNEDIKMIDLVGGLLDGTTVFPVALIILLNMLQDRRRPLWPIAVLMAPLVAGGVFSVATRSYVFLPMTYFCFLILCVGLVIYMVFALRQYGRWLRDNYADLEHKELWQSFVVLAIILLAFVFYVLIYEGPAYQYAMQVVIIILVCYLLWRVETLSDLSIPVNDAEEETIITEDAENNDLPSSVYKKIGLLLQQHCEEPQLFLQYDLTISQLAQIIGTNRLYLSQYFSSQGTTYNAYINGLRIRHFVNLCHEAATTHQFVTARQLACQSGFRSYNTFSFVFKKMMGMTATEWMRNATE